MGTISDVLYCARDWIGYSRWTDPEEGTVFGRWFAEKTGEPYFGVSGVPYCAMFASYCLDWAGVTCAGMPSAYCPDIVSAGEDVGATVSCEDAEAGDLVLFDWGGDGLADHIGIVEENHPSDGYMTTIEGNTSSGAGGSQSNGGGVYRRQRGYGSVRCVVRPDYNENQEDEEDMGLTEHQDKLLASRSRAPTTLRIAEWSSTTTITSNTSARRLPTTPPPLRLSTPSLIPSSRSWGSSSDKLRHTLTDYDIG